MLYSYIILYQHDVIVLFNPLIHCNPSYDPSHPINAGYVRRTSYFAQYIDSI